jgi:hypothetical protein
MDESQSGGKDATKAAFDTQPREGEFYCDGPWMVFTEAYHRRRGYCCKSGCRHCPYGYVAPDTTQL